MSMSNAFDSAGLSPESLPKVHVALASDRNYLPFLEVARASIFESCPTPERLVWHIYDETHLASFSQVEGLGEWNGSLMPYLRLWLPQMLPDVDWVVYADVDTVWERNVCELMDFVLRSAQTEGEHALYWVRDFRTSYRTSRAWLTRASEGTFDPTRYCCSGVCVMNLRRLREMGLADRVLALFARFGTPFYPDQDALNVLFNRDCGLLPPVWNAMGDPSNLPPASEPCVYHITGVGRHFDGRTMPVYPPQYQLWWNVCHATHHVHPRSRLLAALWPLHPLTRLLPLALRERIVRQLFFARVLVRSASRHS